MGKDTRTVGDRGQITIPKRLRERFGIEGGDEVVVREWDGRIVIETPVTTENLAEGYRQRAEGMADLDDEMAGVSREADDQLADAPEW
jgi:AbrB family looped-hinge helix DNA binding protein